jgi:hypothetical protein
MTKELGSEADYSLLIERIKQVFANVPYPGDDNIISTPEHVAVCGECNGLYKALVGRQWTELIDDNDSSGHVSHAMSFFSSAGWQYYLPAYLIQSIMLRRFSSLYFQPRSDPELDEYWAGRISQLTGDQCRVLIAYLLVVLKEDSYSQYMYEKNKEAVEHWKEIYQKIVAHSTGAG